MPHYYYATFHDLNTIHNGRCGFFQDHIKTNFKYPKMLTCDNTSFTLIVHQVNCIVVTNENTYMASQRMKLFFVDIFSSTIRVVCNYGRMQLDFSNICCL
jgi:hypothetical protein